MNVYDFDKTIYDGDSSMDFYFCCLRAHPRILAFAPNQIVGLLRCAAKKIDTTQAKEIFFSFLKSITHTDKLVDYFWRTHSEQIRDWYLKQKQGTDVVVSASPEFLLRPICATLGIQMPIATRMDPRTGIIQGLNCKGAEKVLRFAECYPQGDVQHFYSDSLSDAPLAVLADQAYLVKKELLIPWPEQ